MEYRSSVGAYHIREAGASCVQEIAFAFANAMAYIDAAIKAGQKVDDFAPGISWIFTAGLNMFEEVAKFRAARRLWALHYERTLWCYSTESTDAACACAYCRQCSDCSAAA